MEVGGGGSVGPFWLSQLDSAIRRVVRTKGEGRRSQLSVKNKEKRKEEKDARVSEYRGGVYRGRRIRDGFDENMDNPLERERGNESNSIAAFTTFFCFVLFLFFCFSIFSILFYQLSIKLLASERRTSRCRSIELPLDPDCSVWRNKWDQLIINFDYNLAHISSPFQKGVEVIKCESKWSKKVPIVLYTYTYTTTYIVVWVSLYFYGTICASISFIFIPHCFSPTARCI